MESEQIKNESLFTMNNNLTPANVTDITLCQVLRKVFFLLFGNVSEDITITSVNEQMAT